MNSVVQIKRPGRRTEDTGVILSGAPADEAIIKECATYIRGRIRDTNAAEAWIAVGKALAQLKGQLVKRANRGDNERIGWTDAFKRGMFPLALSTSDHLIVVHKFFVGMSISMKSLPASSNALYLIATNMQPNKVSSCIESGSICPTTTEKEIRAMVKKPDEPKPSPTPPSHDGIAEKVLRSLKQVSKDEQIDILISLCGSLGIRKEELL